MSTESLSTGAPWGEDEPAIDAVLEEALETSSVQGFADIDKEKGTALRVRNSESVSGSNPCRSVVLDCGSQPRLSSLQDGCSSKLRGRTR